MQHNKKNKKWLRWAAGGAAMIGLLALACDSRPVLRIYTVETEKLSAPAVSRGSGRFTPGGPGWPPS